MKYRPVSSKYRRNSVDKIINAWDDDGLSLYLVGVSGTT